MKAIILIALVSVSLHADKINYPDWMRGSYNANNVENSRKITDVLPKVKVATVAETEDARFEAWKKRQPKYILDIKE